MDSFSVIVTVYNCGPVLLRTLRSLDEALAYFHRGPDAASHVAGEVVIVDDGSTDGGSQTAAEFAGARSGWKVVRRDKCSSPSCARNLGVRSSSGDLLFFLDGDDLFLPSHLAECWRALQDPGIDVAKTGVRLAHPVHPDWKSIIENSVVINLCIRRRCHDLFGGFPDYHLFRRIGDDYVHESDLFYKTEDCFYNLLALHLFRWRKLPWETVEYCRHPGNAYDRQYEKFRRPRGMCPDVVPDDVQLRDQLCHVLVKDRLRRLKQQQAAPQA